MVYLAATLLGTGGEDGYGHITHSVLQQHSSQLETSTTERGNTPTQTNGIRTITSWYYEETCDDVYEMLNQTTPSSHPTIAESLSPWPSLCDFDVDPNSLATPSFILNGESWPRLQMQASLTTSAKASSNNTAADIEAQSLKTRNASLSLCQEPPENIFHYSNDNTYSREWFDMPADELLPLNQRVLDMLRLRGAAAAEGDGTKVTEYDHE